MSIINTANFFMVPAQHPRTKVFRTMARKIVPEDGAVYLFSSYRDEPRGVELRDGSVNFVKDPLFDVPRGRVLVGIVGQDKDAVLAQVAAKIAARDLTMDSVQALKQPEVDAMRIEAEPELYEELRPSEGDCCLVEVQALLDQMLSLKGHGPDVMARFQELGDEAVTHLEWLGHDKTYGMAAGVVLRNLRG